MSREIKFRAWDSVREKMFYWDEILGQAKPHWVNKNTPIMQFIGLKDKNGKEIYEGDILRYCSSIVEVVFEDWSASFRMKHNEKRMVRMVQISKSMWQQLEVIGNKFENPKLLT